MRLALLSKENPERMGNRKCQLPIAFYGAKRREYVATYRGSLGVHSFSSIVPEVWLSKDTFWNGWAPAWARPPCYYPNHFFWLKEAFSGIVKSLWREGSDWYASLENFQFYRHQTVSLAEGVVTLAEGVSNAVMLRFCSLCWSSGGHRNSNLVSDHSAEKPRWCWWQRDKELKQ